MKSFFPGGFIWSFAPNSDRNQVEKVFTKGINYEFNEDEIRVLMECDYESFYFRSLPLSTLLSFLTYKAVRTGYLKPNKIWGPTPKVLIAITVGYFVGKYSYLNSCIEKLMDLPDSELGFMLRQSRRAKEDAAESPPGKDGRTSHLGESLDLEKDKPELKGLDEKFKESIKKTVYEEFPNGTNADIDGDVGLGKPTSV